MDAHVLMQGAAQMPITELERFVQQLNALIVQRKTTDTNYRQRFLLGKINETILGKDKTERYQFLIYKHEFNVLSDAEYQELMHLTEEEETIRVQRLTYLVELAQLKGFSLEQLMENLGLNQRANA